MIFPILILSSQLQLKILGSLSNNSSKQPKTPRKQDSMALNVSEYIYMFDVK